MQLVDRIDRRTGLSAASSLQSQVEHLPECAASPLRT